MKAGTIPLAAELVSVRQLTHAQRIVVDLQKLGCRWRPIGDRENNFGTINIGSDPGHALVERVTNAIDAVVEREAMRQASKKRGGTPGSPREAVQVWFGVPAGRLSNLSEIKRRQDLADNVVVRLHDGSAKRTPSVEIRDRGMGSPPHRCPRRS